MKVATIALAVSLLILAVPQPLLAQGCGLRFVAAGDDIPAGHEVSESERYPNQLYENHLKKWGAWCQYNIAKNGTTSSTYITGGQLAQTWNYRPDLITLSLGEQNSTVVDLIDSCFKKVKSHDFAGANGCAAAVLANSTVWSSLNANLITTFQQYRVIMAGRPRLVVAVLGYPNPYPKATTALTKVPELCTPLIDTTLTCTTRWLQLPPALELIDQAFKKLNTTIANAVAPFANSTQGRFVYVNTYDKLRDHCMKMEVSFKTTVNHGEYTENHDSPYAVNMGCSENWFVEGDDGTDKPFYLIPAVSGILVEESQKTENMGVWPNADAHKCIADLIWEADTIDPGTSPLKWKLWIPEAPKSDICQ